jgi:hypothetical protein
VRIWLCGGERMTRELVLAGFIMAVGLCMAGMGTHLYQAIFKQDAMLRYDGKTYFHTLGHLAMSFLCGPYIMLQMGWRQESNGTIAMGAVLLSSLVAFGWSFITGLLFMSVYVAFL